MPGRRAPEEQRREDILRAAYAVAARDGLTGVTARAVAAEAEISSGLIFFYFESIENLLGELLAWLLGRTIVAAEVPELAVGIDDPTAALLAIVARDVERLPKQRVRVELFFDFWVLGTRHPAVRRTIRRALERYRAAFLPVTAAVVASDPERYAGVTADGLAAVVASFMEGCALQVVMDPSRFDVERSLAALAALVRQPVVAP